MSNVFPGCRVRILYSRHFPELAGLEGRVIERAYEYMVSDATCEWRVAPDCWGSPIAPSGKYRGSFFAPNGRQLEPILPEGAAPSELSYTELMDRLKAGEVERV